MADSISEVGDEPVERRESQSVAGSPRLRIHHFLIWTAITALLLAWTRIHLDSWNSTRAHARIEQPTGESTVAYVILGGQITIAICVLRWLQLKLLQKVEPAEWITFIAAVDALLMIWLSIYTTTVEWGPWMQIPIDCIEVAWIAFLIGSIIVRRDTFLWRCSYALIALEKALGLLMLLLLTTGHLSSYLDQLPSVNKWFLHP